MARSASATVTAWISLRILRSAASAPADGVVRRTRLPSVSASPPDGKWMTLMSIALVLSRVPSNHAGIERQIFAARARRSSTDRRDRNVARAALLARAAGAHRVRQLAQHRNGLGPAEAGVG